MSSKYALEICAFNLQSCLVAEKAGAARVELCADVMQGGTTPSYGLMRQVREKVSIQVFPIIRPREGDFCYDEDEIAIMRHDIAVCKELECDGISVGVLLPDGSIDTEKMKRMVEWAYPMQVSCHRAFDVCSDVFKALEDVIACGCVRILTSGQKPKAMDAIDILRELVKIAGSRISIMPGGGLRSSNIAMLKETGALEFHTSARVSPQPSAVNTDTIAAGHYYISDEKEIRSILAQL